MLLSRFTLRGVSGGLGNAAAMILFAIVLRLGVARRSLDMVDVAEILTHWQAGRSSREISGESRGFAEHDRQVRGSG